MSRREGMEVSDALLETVAAYARRHDGREPDVIVLTHAMVDRLADEVYSFQRRWDDPVLHRMHVRHVVASGLATFHGSTLVVRPRPDAWVKPLRLPSDAG